MKKLLLLMVMMVTGIGLAFAEQWTVVMETSVETKWIDVDSYSTLTQGAQSGPTRELTINADTKAEAMERAKSACYDACDSNWMPDGVIQKDGRTYRVYRKIRLTNYYIKD